jgi:hypothetical protein
VYNTAHHLECYPKCSFIRFDAHSLMARKAVTLRAEGAVTSPPTHDPTLLVHGGAWAIPADAAAAHEAGVRRALEAGYAILALGGSALDAVEAAVTVLEDDPTFDAGRGSFLTSDGRVQLDALLMDGGRMKAGGVACVERLRNPIQAARLVLERVPTSTSSAPAPSSSPTPTACPSSTTPSWSSTASASASPTPRPANPPASPTKPSPARPSRRQRSRNRLHDSIQEPG